MTKYREILRLHSQGISKNNIAKCCECSRNTVTGIIEKATAMGLGWPLPEGTTDEKLRRRLYPETRQDNIRKEPDYEHVHREMAKSGVTLSLLWYEYSENCRQSSAVPYMYTQFCKHYRDYANTAKATLHIEHKPGEQMEVDWAGQTAGIIDTDTGEIIPVYVFVAVLSSSGYAYVEAFLSQNQEELDRGTCQRIPLFRRRYPYPCIGQLENRSGKSGVVYAGNQPSLS